MNEESFLLNQFIFDGEPHPESGKKIVKPRRVRDYFDGKETEDHMVVCKCGKLLWLNNEDLTPPVTVVECPECGFRINYYENYTNYQVALRDIERPYWDSLSKDNKTKVRALRKEFDMFALEEIAYEFVKSGFSESMTKDTLTRRMLKKLMEEENES